MSIDKTQHLCKLSHQEIKSVYEKWPNPLMPLGFMMGGLIAMMFGLMNFNQDQSNVGSLIGGCVAFIMLTLGSGIYNLVKLSKAKKLLSATAQTHNLPEKKLFKEFRKNLKHIKGL